MASKVLKAVIMGAPASGKGTISERIVKNFGLVHISAGDKLRHHVKENTPIGQEVHQYIKEGKLAPDQTMINLISQELKQVENKSWLLDGFPRTVTQAEKLWNIETLNIVLNLDVPFDVIISRVSGRWVHLPSGRVYNEDFNAPKVKGKDDVTGEALVQREDDRPEIVRKRLEQYEALTKPVLQFYKNKGILTEFRGETSDKIWSEIQPFLHKFISNL